MSGYYETLTAGSSCATGSSGPHEVPSRARCFRQVVEPQDLCEMDGPILHLFGAPGCKIARRDFLEVEVFCAVRWD